MDPNQLVLPIVLRDFHSSHPDMEKFLGVDLGNLGDDPEVYRWFYLQENNRRGSDYTPMIRLAKALNKTGTALDAEAHRLMDVSQWMRAVAFQSLWGLVDTFPFDNPHNFIIYFRPEDGRAVVGEHHRSAERPQGEPGQLERLNSERDADHGEATHDAGHCESDRHPDP